MWQVGVGDYSDQSFNASTARETVILPVTFDCSLSLTEANFFDLVEDVQQQFRENNVSSTHTVRYKMRGKLDEKARHAEMQVTMTTWTSGAT